jgi:hypothetical protein
VKWLTCDGETVPHPYPVLIPPPHAVFYLSHAGEMPGSTRRLAVNTRSRVLAGRLLIVGAVAIAAGLWALFDYLVAELELWHLADRYAWA